ncbi:MAG: hypothetical protein U1F56_16090 [Rubrivivax sp.]
MHSPAGGRGMNMGIWTRCARPTLVQAPGGDEDALDRYAGERRPVAGGGGAGRPADAAGHRAAGACAGCCKQPGAAPPSPGGADAAMRRSWRGGLEVGVPVSRAVAAASAADRHEGPAPVGPGRGHCRRGELRRPGSNARRHLTWAAARHRCRRLRPGSRRPATAPGEAGGRPAPVRVEAARRARTTPGRGRPCRRTAPRRHGCP